MPRDSGGATEPVGTIAGTISRAVGLVPEDACRMSCFCTLALEHRITDVSDGALLREASLTEAQIRELVAERTLQAGGDNAPGVHTTAVQPTKKGKAGMYAEWYSEFAIPLFPGWERGTIVLRLHRKDEGGSRKTAKGKILKYSVMVLASLELAAAGLRGEAGAAEQFFHDMLPTKGSPIQAARIKLSLVLQGAAATGSQPAQSVRSSFALKAPGFLGGPRTLKLKKSTLTVSLGGGSVERKLDLAAVKCVKAQDSDTLLIFASPDHEKEPIKYLATNHDAGAVVAQVQARLHIYAIDVAIPFLVQTAVKKSDSMEAVLDETRLSLQRTSSHDHSLAHQSSLTTRKAHAGGGGAAGGAEDLDVGEHVKLSTMQLLNCELLMADTTNDVGRAIQRFATEFKELKASATTAAKVRQSHE